MILEYDKTLQTVKVNTIIAFLKARGWAIFKTTDTAFYLYPPPAIKVDEHSYLRIPLPDYEQADDFPLVINLVLNTIADLYVMEKSSLVRLFSQTLEEIRAEMPIRQQILEFA